jgi:hypothetical protein
MTAPGTADAERPPSARAGGHSRPFLPGEARSEIIKRVARRLEEMPVPTWRQEAGHGERKQYAPHDFDSYRAQMLRANWSEIEMNLRSVFTHYGDEVTWFDARSAEEAIDILEHARSALECASPNVDVVDDDLGRARRLLVWLIPGPWLDVQIQAVGALLDRSEDPQAKAFKFVATGDDRRYELDDAIGVLNQSSSAWAINSSLQRRRLRMFMIAASAGLVIEIALAPLLVSRTSLIGWGLMPIGGPVVLAWLAAIGIATIGAMGALLSAFLRMRDKPVMYRDYQVSGIEIWSRVSVGAMIAVLSFFLLSFNVMPGMSASSPGTYLLVAFIAGFSERFFLGLLSIDGVGSERPPTTMTPSGPPPKPKTATDAREPSRAPGPVSDLPPADP